MPILAVRFLSKQWFKELDRIQEDLGGSFNGRRGNWQGGEKSPKEIEYLLTEDLREDVLDSAANVVIASIALSYAITDLLGNQSLDTITIEDIEYARVCVLAPQIYRVAVIGCGSLHNEYYMLRAELNEFGTKRTMLIPHPSKIIHRLCLA